ncbi:NADH dehydrogenase (ubiquinone) complex I, assembly factor 6 isoform X2 [Monomorium pharaonis]|uniref:NADH dehydrogenase (ubiquinone) complex I, assembly factor 6 isoform X2 n=1 Tax=Monomorium pharaonis TaxID=307658 RepID=UPI00102E110E|nr:NADH dehydrogenase (ubiquinone) complex I, assembly factor 6 isoform X2 [Monomorium pharaonis]
MNKFSIIERNIRSQLRRMNTNAARQKQTPTEYCLQLVRKSDYENYLCTLLLPHSIKSAAFAIRAFNVEVAQVEDQVSDSRIGAMRLQFWTDALNETYNNNPPKSPVAMELHRILQRYKLSKRYFKRLIEARLNKLSGSIFVDLESLERYCDYTTSSIYYLLLEAQGTTNVKADHAASHFGKSHGLVTLIRSVPYNARKRAMGRSSAGFKDAVLEVASCAKRHLKVATSLKKTAEKDLNVLFLPGICIENYLEELRKVDFDVFHPRLQRRNGFLPLQLLWRKMWS